MEKGLHFLLSFRRQRQISLLICLLLFGYVNAQQPLSQRDTLSFSFGDTLSLSETYLVPFSEAVYLKGLKLDSEQYGIDFQTGKICLTDSSLSPGEGSIFYRYFSRKPEEEVSIRRFTVVKDSTDPDKYLDVHIVEKYKREYDTFWETSRIKKSGSISRGLTLGNSQGLSVTSGLRLQLEGDLGDGLKIVGAITDENIPIQPDGTTQQISDFDKIFIKLQKDAFSVTVGDYDVRNRNTSFANFYRNVQGVKLSMLNEKSKVNISGAVAKGQFHTNSMIGREGVSGPYRLTGKNGERFFTVLAGSETVYLNGKRLLRGEANDYIIDYNTAEIYFTARHVITNISRIVIDFEYTDRNFNRSLTMITSRQRLFGDKLNLHFSYGRDADNQNAPFEDPDGFNAVRDSLSQIGDNSGLATTSGILEAGYSETEPRYERRDTLINGQQFERYVFSQDSLNAIYKIFFSFVGEGNGFYEKDQSGINNNVFNWVAPDSAGNPQGDWAPVRSWALPRLLQMADLKLEYKISDNISLYTETALSSEDQNRLSSVDDADNVDFANVSGISLENIRLGDSLSLKVDLKHQYVGERYTNLDRVYKAEYNRVWNFEDTDDRADEQIASSRVTLNYKNRLSLQAEAGLRNTGPGKRAIRQVYSVKSSLRKFLQGNYSFTSIYNQNDSIGRVSRWNRHEGDVFIGAKKWKSGVEIWIEDKEEIRADTLSTGSFSFVDLKPYIRTVNLRKFDADFSWNYRLDRDFKEGILLDKGRAFTQYYKWAYKPTTTFRIQNITSYRVFEVIDSTFASEELSNARIFNTNLQSTYSSKNRFIYANLLYEVAAEQVARRDVNFLMVNPGLGQYEWIDYNGNELQEVDEFELSTNPLTANFIRVIRPTQELFPTTRLSFSGNLRVDFKKLLKNTGKPLNKLVRNIRSITSFRLSQNKEKGSEVADFLIDFGDISQDTTLLDASYNLREDLNFFQNNPKGDFRFIFLDNQSRQFLSTGSELRTFTYWAASQRLNLDKTKSIEAETRIGTKKTEAARFDTRNFDIKFFETRPAFNFQFSRKLRLSFGYEFKNKVNEKDSLGVTMQDTVLISRVNLHKIKADAKWNIRDRNNLAARIELINVSQNRSAGFAADYELRDGLQKGVNGIWQVFLTWYLFKNVEFSFTYDGRASQINPVVHSGRVQIRAFF